MRVAGAFRGNDPCKGLRARSATAAARRRLHFPLIGIRHPILQEIGSSFVMGTQQRLAIFYRIFAMRLKTKGSPVAGSNAVFPFLFEAQDAPAVAGAGHVVWPVHALIGLREVEIAVVAGLCGRVPAVFDGKIHDVRRIVEVLFIGGLQRVDRVVVGHKVHFIVRHALGDQAFAAGEHHRPALVFIRDLVGAAGEISVLFHQFDDHVQPFTGSLRALRHQPSYAVAEPHRSQVRILTAVFVFRCLARVG